MVYLLHVLLRLFQMKASYGDTGRFEYPSWSGLGRAYDQELIDAGLVEIVTLPDSRQQLAVTPAGFAYELKHRGKRR